MDIVNCVVYLNESSYTVGVYEQESDGYSTRRSLALSGFLFNMCGTPEDRVLLERVRIVAEEGEIDGAIGDVWAEVFINRSEERGEIELRGNLTLPPRLYEEVLLIAQARTAAPFGAFLSLFLGLDPDREFEPDMFTSKVPHWADVETRYGVQNIWDVELRPTRLLYEESGEYPEVLRKIKGLDNIESVVSLR